MKEYVIKAINTENLLCASHPMNCCMLGTSLCATKNYRVHEARTRAFIRSPLPGLAYVGYPTCDPVQTGHP